MFQTRLYLYVIQKHTWGKYLKMVGNLSYFKLTCLLSELYLPIKNGILSNIILIANQFVIPPEQWKVHFFET